MYIKASIYFIILDFIWIFLNRKLYNDLSYSIQNDYIKLKKIKLISFFIAYFFLLYGLNYIVIPYNIPVEYGMTVYGVYSFTNHILFNNYSFNLAIIDTLWGIILYSFANNFNNN